MNTRLFNLYKTAKTGHIVIEKWNYFLIVKSNVHCKQALTAPWSKRADVYTLRTGARLQNIKHFATYCQIEPDLHFCFEVFLTAFTSHVSALTVSRVSLVRLREMSVL